jgi:hypothetical protein
MRDDMQNVSRINDRGQTTPFFLGFLLLMTMFVGLVANLGQAVNRRMALQIVADAGAWTGATNMAVGMNALAEVNGKRREMDRVFPGTLQVAGILTFLHVKFPPLKFLDLAVLTLHTGLTAALDALDAGIQLGYAKSPYDEAARVTWYNSQDLFPGEQLRWYEGFRLGVLGGRSDVADHTMPFLKSRPTVCVEQPSPFMPLPLPCLADEAPVKGSVFYCSANLDQLCDQYEYTRWWEKTGPDILFVWVVEAPATRPHYNPFGLFGDDAIPSMQAAAAAKPVGGTLETGDARYRTRFVPLTDVMSVAPLGGVHDALLGRRREIAY